MPSSLLIKVFLSGGIGLTGVWSFTWLPCTQQTASITTRRSSDADACVSACSFASHQSDNDALPAFVQVPIVPVIPKAPPQVRPAELTPQQQLSLRCSAIHRILANGNTPSQETRINLLSRLATKSPAGDGIGDEILQHMFRDYHTNHGHELALTWLFALYKEHCTQTDNARSTVSGLSDIESGAAAQRAVKAESVAEPASGRTDSEMSVGASDALVKRSGGGGAEAGPSCMDIDGLKGKQMFSN